MEYGKMDIYGRTISRRTTIDYSKFGETEVVPPPKAQLIAPPDWDSTVFAWHSEDTTQLYKLLQK